jgi:hypothetical protein
MQCSSRLALAIGLVAGIAGSAIGIAAMTIVPIRVTCALFISSGTLSSLPSASMANLRLSHSLTRT